MMKFENDEAGFKARLKELKPYFDACKDYMDKDGNLASNAPDKAKKAYAKFKELEKDLVTIYEPRPGK